jgi:hypothetical protein
VLYSNSGVTHYYGIKGEIIAIKAKASKLNSTARQRKLPTWLSYEIGRDLAAVY